MTDSRAKGRWRRVLRATFCGALFLLAGINVLIGTAWYVSLGVTVTGLIIMIGHGRIFHAGVNRSGDNVMCRYIPWYEGNVYGLLVLLPLLGVASMAAGHAPGNPTWLRFVGILLLGVAPLSAFFIVRMWRRCLLCISPSVLTVQLDARGSQLTEIRRERVQLITPKIVPIGALEGLQVAIVYHAEDLIDDMTKTVLLGPPPGPAALQVSVEPTNLLDALVAWKDATHNDPGELLDRIERILRGRSTAGG